MGLSDQRVGAVVAVSDFEAAKRFYEGQLGLEPADSQEQGVAYPCADGTSLFVYVSPDNAGRNPATSAGWEIDDLDGTMAELAARGVTFEQYDQPGIKTDAHGVFDAGPFRAAWMKDPDGNTLAMTERA
jgi:catechol 2,3-dioxygenase-like lactoylglutathione lyase family enzyme